MDVAAMLLGVLGPLGVWYGAGSGNTAMLLGGGGVSVAAIVLGILGKRSSGLAWIGILAGGFGVFALFALRAIGMHRPLL